MKWNYVRVMNDCEISLLSRTHCRESFIRQFFFIKGAKAS